MLGETLAEEKAADVKLSALAESGINDAATAGDSDDEEAEADDADEPVSAVGGQDGGCVSPLRKWCGQGVDAPARRTPLDIVKGRETLPSLHSFLEGLG